MHTFICPFPPLSPPILLHRGTTHNPALSDLRTVLQKSRLPGRRCRISPGIHRSLKHRQTGNGHGPGSSHIIRHTGITGWGPGLKYQERTSYHGAAGHTSAFCLYLCQSPIRAAYHLQIASGAGQPQSFPPRDQIRFFLHTAPGPEGRASFTWSSRGSSSSAIRSTTAHKVPTLPTPTTFIAISSM